jgi:Uma2 family endonuclease
MPSILENIPKDSLPQPYRFTVDQLRKMYEMALIEPDKKIELINGEPMMMTPIGFKHMKVVDKLNKLFNELFYKNNLSFTVSIQNPIKENNKNLLYPDIAIYSEEVYKKEEIPSIKDALLIIEVSDTTLDYDKNIKLPIYAKGKAKEVWIVNLKESILEKYTNPSGKLFKDIHIFKKNEEIEVFNSKINLLEIL